MIGKLKLYPFYLLLLPIFFVLHGYLENFGFISLTDVLVLMLSYCGMTLGIGLFSYLIFKDINKAAFITGAWMSFFFFFAALHEFLKEHAARFFSKYSFMLSLSVVLLVLLYILLKRTKSKFFKFNLFVNTLLIVYILFDMGGLIWKSFNPSYQKLSVYSFARKREYKVCDTCARPNIYFLLFDEYSSSLALKEKWNYNNRLDDSLREKGFSVQRKSHSNYNFTAFSMSATLNMSFIEGFKNVKAVTADDYANCNILIRDNQVIEFLDAHGYDIVNYSMFDLAGHPASVEQSFLPLKTKLITDRTLFARMNKDIGWLLITRFPFNLFTKNHFLKHRENNNRFLAAVKEETKKKNPKPKFVYAHFYMPHPPFFYDSVGNLKDNELVYHESKIIPPSSYLQYVTYTNREILKLVDTIQANDPKSIILVMSDHGFRVPTKEAFPKFFFQNMNAVYFPDKDYSLLYDSITNVNQFRTIFNKTFNQKFPLLKDSSILLIDKK